MNSRIEHYKKFRDETVNRDIKDEEFEDTDDDSDISETEE